MVRLLWPGDYEWIYLTLDALRNGGQDQGARRSPTDDAAQSMRVSTATDGHTLGTTAPESIRNAATPRNPEKPRRR